MGLLDQTARMGRGGDTRMAHMTPGEIVIPKEVAALRPDIVKQVGGQVKQMGGDPNTIMVGHGRKNPRTGIEEFATEAEVRAAYKNILGRDPDPEGLAFWMDQANNFSEQNFITVAKQVAEANPEQFPGVFQKITDWENAKKSPQGYQGILGAVNNWTGKDVEGPWGDVLDKVNSATDKYGITSAYGNVLGRTPSEDELAYWLDPANNYSLDTFKAAAKPEIITKQYTDILGRAPNEDELAYWMTGDNYSLDNFRKAAGTEWAANNPAPDPTGTDETNTPAPNPGGIKITPREDNTPVHTYKENIDPIRTTANAEHNNEYARKQWYNGEAPAKADIPRPRGLLSHVTPGEVAIPANVANQRPDLVRSVQDQTRQMGLNANNLEVGKGRINPITGLEEFASNYDGMTGTEILAANRAKGITGKRDTGVSNYNTYTFDTADPYKTTSALTDSQRATLARGGSISDTGRVGAYVPGKNDVGQLTNDQASAVMAKLGLTQGGQPLQTAVYNPTPTPIVDPPPTPIAPTPTPTPTTPASTKPDIFAGYDPVKTSPKPSSLSLTNPTPAYIPPAPTPAPAQQVPTSFQAVQRPLNPETDTVQGQMNGLLNQDNPYMQRMGAKGAEASNARGLLNTSMGTQAAQAAAIDAALPIAQQDAGTYFNQGLTNQSAQNQFGLTGYQGEIASNLSAQGATQQLAQTEYEGLIQSGLSEQQAKNEMLLTGYKADIVSNLSAQEAWQNIDRDNNSANLATDLTQFKQQLQDNSLILQRDLTQSLVNAQWDQQGASAIATTVAAQTQTMMNGIFQLMQDPEFEFNENSMSWVTDYMHASWMSMGQMYGIELEVV